MEISASIIKELRERTGAGFMECKEALKEANGDIEKAVEILRKKGALKAEKKAKREAREGLIGAYIHAGGKIGVLVEVNCETDFVARTDEFQQLVKDIAMQIAAMSPEYVSREDVPPEVIEKEKEIYREEALRSGKPERVVEKIVEGKLEKFFEEKCLLEQPFIKDESKKVKDIVTEVIAKLGENIKVARFVRYQVGVK
ncbi:MAG: translation elongation factor Ts [Thermosulfidibacteraceae bacterium]|jgi:elongation factor Ts